VIVAEFFDVGESRTVAWGRRPEAAALVAELADPGRGWDAMVVGEYERAFYGSQYAAMAPLFEHYGVQLWMPEAGGRVDFASEHDEHTMTVLGLSSTPMTRPPAPCAQEPARPPRPSPSKQANRGRSGRIRKEEFVTTAGRPALAAACAQVMSCHARKRTVMGNYCVRDRPRIPTLLYVLQRRC
jgi:hypothetical protein